METDMSSSNNLKQDVPPPYDQVTSVDIDSATAPLLRETFSGSIFGTSTIVTFELATGSYPTSIASNPIAELFEKAQDYTFVIRDFLGCVQANGKVSNSSQTLDTTLNDVWGKEIFQFRKQVTEPPNPSIVINRFISKVFNEKKANTVHTFEISKNGVCIGFVTYGDKEPSETCLKIYFGDGNNEFVVKSLTRDEFIIFRDQSSSVPLCNINMEPCTFTGKIIFHPETGITTEEQLLCTASAFAYKTCLTQLNIVALNDFSLRMGFWLLTTFILMMVVCLCVFSAV